MRSLFRGLNLPEKDCPEYDVLYPPSSLVAHVLVDPDRANDMFDDAFLTLHSSPNDDPCDG